MEQQLKKIHLGIKRLQDLHQNSLVEIEKLKAENSLLKEQVSKGKVDLTSLNEKLLLDGITNKSATGDVEKKQMKLKINELVREVDKCIALLNQ